MRVSELKEKLHKEIDSLEDATALQLLHDAASELGKVKRKDILDVLSAEQMERLNTSLEQAKSGDTVPHAEAMKMVAQWRCK